MAAELRMRSDETSSPVTVTRFFLRRLPSVASRDFRHFVVARHLCPQTHLSFEQIRTAET